jgi:cell division protein FtsB
VRRPTVGTLGRLLAVAVVGVALFAMGQRALGPNGYQALQERERQKHQLEKEIRDLTIHNIELNRDVDKLNSDPKAIEDVARQDLKLAKPGEYIYILPPDPPRK